MDNGALSTASFTGSRKVGDGGVPDQFPAGLRVLVVDDDPICLKILEKMLRNCLYEVTTCSRAVIALSMLRERKDGFDLVISDVYMPDMDGFKLLEHIGLEMDLPVIMMSADDGKDVVMKGVTHGACDYLIKPVRIEAIKNIWQHVVRKRRNELKDVEHSGSVEDSDRHRKPSDDADYAFSVNEGSWRHSKRRKDVKDEEDEGEDHEDSSTLKKPRVVWSVELHQQFVAAVNQLSIDKAVPKKILELMKVPGLTRENVASHLQKYRLYLRRLSGVSHHPGGLNTSFVGETTFGSISSLDGLDLQALAVSGQLPSQNLVALQAGLGRTTMSSGMGMSVVDQMNLFNSDAQTSNPSKVGYDQGQQLNHKQLNLLHGLPTTMEAKQLAHLHQPVQSFGNVALQVTEGSSGYLNLPVAIRTGSSSHGDAVHGCQNRSLMLQMSQQRQNLPVSQNQTQIQVDMSGQPQSRVQILNEISGGHTSGIPSSVGQQINSNEITGQVLGMNGTVMNGKGTQSGGVFISNPSYMSLSQTSCVDFPVIHSTELPGNAFPLASTTGLSNLASSRMFQDTVPTTRTLEGMDNSANIKGLRGLAPSYGIFNELGQNKRQEWVMQNMNLSYDAAQHVNSIQNNPNFSQAVLSHQNVIAIQKNEQNGNEPIVGKGMVSTRAENLHGNQNAPAQLHNSVMVDNSSLRVKTEGMPQLGCENMLLNEHFVQDDIMDALFKQQQQDGAGQVESEFNFDGCQMDNISV